MNTGLTTLLLMPQTVSQGDWSGLPGRSAMELILEDADIITMAPSTPAPGRPAPQRPQHAHPRQYIAAVGSAAQIRAAAAPRTPRWCRLDGATVVPGLIDAHCHVSDVGYLAAGADCSQPAAPDIPAIVARLRDAAGRTPDGLLGDRQRVRGIQAARGPASRPGPTWTPPCRTARRCCITRRCTPAC